MQQKLTAQAKTSVVNKEVDNEVDTAKEGLQDLAKEQGGRLPKSKHTERGTKVTTTSNAAIVIGNWN